VHGIILAISSTLDLQVVGTLGDFVTTTHRVFHVRGNLICPTRIESCQYRRPVGRLRLDQRILLGKTIRRQRWSGENDGRQNPDMPGEPGTVRSDRVHVTRCMTCCRFNPETRGPIVLRITRYCVNCQWSPAITRVALSEGFEPSDDAMLG